MSDVKRRLTKEEREAIRAQQYVEMTRPHSHDITSILALLDDLDAANAEIEFEKGEVKRYWNACDAMENEIERLRKALEREKAKTRIMSTFAVDIAGARTSREFRLAEEKAMTALRALGEGRDDA